MPKLSKEEETWIEVLRNFSGSERRDLFAALVAEDPPSLTDRHVRNIAEFLKMDPESHRDAVVEALTINYYFNKKSGFPTGNPLDGITDVPLLTLATLVNDFDYALPTR